MSGSKSYGYPSGRVLNAFRHHRGGHPPRLGGWGILAMVLNAFRHHRGGHMKVVKLSPITNGAQRLSASQRGACQARSAIRSSGQVLNAFRHHRGGHARSSTRSGSRWKVLNAFRHHRGGHDPGERDGNGTRVVLNAFRHHRGGHHATTNSRERSHRVLNAFRHHRGGHVTIGVGICGFGIGAQRLSASQRGAWTAWRAASGIGTRVLNAFRHHRGGHPGGRRWATRPPSAQRLSASQRGAWTDGSVLPSTSRCSTPFGITEGGIAAITELTITSNKCSTPFGITEGGIRRTSARPTTRSGAQRLSASQRGAYPNTSSAPHQPSGCSTPFGITEGGIPHVRTAADRPTVLNAFRHHRGGHEGGSATPNVNGAVLNAFRHHRGGHRGRQQTIARKPSRCSTPFGITEGGM